LRRSHVAYLGGNREAVVRRCEVCGTTQQGPAMSRDERVGAGVPVQPPSARQRKKRPLPDGGSPDNPVLDSDLARLLRERFGGEEPPED